MGLDNEDIKQLIAILQRGLVDDNADDAPPTPKKTKGRPKDTATKQEKPKRINKFDQMAESRMHKEDVAIDKKLNRTAPTPRRDPFKPLSVSCRVCGRTETVDPSMIEGIDRYKCNKCASSAG